MGMDVWHSVTLTDIELTDKQFGKLPDWNLIDSDGGWDFWPERHGVNPDGTEYTAPLYYSVSGTGRYDDTCAMEEWAVKFTTKHPGATVTIDQEWYEQDQGQSSDVYRNGELVRAESKMSYMVPIDIGALLEESKRAIIAYHMPIGEEQTVIEGLVRALEKLVKGLS
jgi:hypothetical protein